MAVPAALLWDLDGVLVDSAAFHYQAFRQVLADRGYQLDEDTFRHSLLGLRNDAILQRLLGELPPQEMQELARRKEEAFRRLIAGQIQPLPGSRELALAAHRRKLLQAIVTSTPRQNALLVLRSLSLEEAFPVVVAEEDVSRGKPDPQGFLLAAQRLGVPPRVCAVIEDAPEGVQAAKAAGMRCLAVATTRPPAMLQQADLVVPSLADPLAWRFLLGEGS